MKTMRLNRLHLSNALCLTIAAVGAGACTTAADPIPVYSIALQPQLDSVEVGQTFGAWLVVLQDVAGNTLTGRTLTWESSNEAVATIDANTGVLTGVLAGQTIVNVRAEGKTAAATIKVLVPILSIVVTKDSIDVPLSTSQQIGAQLVGPGGVAITNRTITWMSENPGIAVVSTQGVVTPISLGTTTIRLRAGTKEASVRVRVVGEPVSSVRITPPLVVHLVRLGQSKQLGAECLSASLQVLTGRSVTWQSLSPVVASVSTTGLVTGIALGTATIAATCENATGTTNVLVTLPQVTSVSITPTSMLLVFPLNTGQMTAIARDSAGNILSLQNRTVQWFSSNTQVANVTQTGFVTAHIAGTSEITVSVDGVPSGPALVTAAHPFAMSEPREMRSPGYERVRDPRSFAGWSDNFRR